MAIKERYIVNAKGERVEVILPIAEYERLIAAASGTDPDAARKLKKGFREGLLRQENEFAEGKRGKPFKDVVKHLELD